VLDTAGATSYPPRTAVLSVARETGACGSAVGWAAMVERVLRAGAAGVVRRGAATESAGRAESAGALFSGTANISEDATSEGNGGMAAGPGESAVVAARRAGSAMAGVGLAVDAAGG